MKVGDKVKLLIDCMGIGIIPKGSVGIISFVNLDDTFSVYFGEDHGTVDGLREHHFESVIGISAERLMQITGANEVQQSARYNSGKVNPIELNPEFIMGMAEVLTKSRHKYPEFNWALPTKLSTPYQSLFRHLMAFQSGEDFDPEDGCHHMLKVAVNAMFLHYHSVNNPEYAEDRFFKKDKK
jgi:hypothetical protein